MKEKELKVIISETGSDKLKDNLDKVDIKMKALPISAKEIAEVYKKGFEDISQQAILHTIKIEAIITELNTHVGQIIDKNVEAGEKLAESIEKSADAGLSAVKVKAIETSSIIGAMVNKIRDKTEEQTTRLTKQKEKNKTLLEEYAKETEKYSNKNTVIGILNIKAHKENVTAHIGELKKLKDELEAATLHTELQYNAMCMHYEKDSEEFKKAQEEKATELKKLQDKIKVANEDIKKQNDDYLTVWKMQHGEIQKKINKFSDKDGKGKIDDFIEKHKKYIDDFGSSIDQIKKGFDTIAEKETSVLNKKYEEKNKKLDKELEKVNAEVKKYEDEKKQLEKEQEEAEKKAEKYKADIAKIKNAFEIKDAEPDKENSETPTEPIENTDISALSSTDEALSDKEAEDKNKITPPTDEEMEAAQARISELEKLAAAEEAIVIDKQGQIETANKNITESNRSVLLEQMRIADEKAKLEAEKEKKEAEIEKKKQKRKEQIEKLEKLKAKAQAVYDIADATKNIAKGVAVAWGKGPILGPPLAALVAIQGAIQLGVMSQQLKYLEDGGLLSGKRHSQGGMRIEGTNIEVEGGEYVVNRESTRKNLGLVRYINSQRKELTPSDVTGFFARASQGFELPFQREFAAGGMMPAPFLAPNFSSDNDALVHAIKNIRIESGSSGDNEALINAIKDIRIEPKVAVTDIIRAQEEAVQVDRWSGN